MRTDRRVRLPTRETGDRMPRLCAPYASLLDSERSPPRVGAGNGACRRRRRAQALDKVSFGTNWVAEAEHGGFYQALADGTYRNYGLDVTIVPGGPNVNNRILLPVGKLDFFMSANTLQSFDAVEQNVPTLAVAAMFQKDPSGLHCPSGSGNRELRGSEEAHAVCFQGRVSRAISSGSRADFGFSEATREAVHLQSATVPRRQAQRHAGLCHVGALRDREAGGL